MNVIFLLIPVALLFVAIAIWVFFWAVKTDQFEDLDRQGSSILFEEEAGKTPQAPQPDKNDAPEKNQSHDL